MTARRRVSTKRKGWKTPCARASLEKHTRCVFFVPDLFASAEAEHDKVGSGVPQVRVGVIGRSCSTRRCLGRLLLSYQTVSRVLCLFALAAERSIFLSLEHVRHKSGQSREHISSVGVCVERERESWSRGSLSLSLSAPFRNSDFGRSTVLPSPTEFDAFEPCS